MTACSDDCATRCARMNGPRMPVFSSNNLDSREAIATNWKDLIFRNGLRDKPELILDRCYSRDTTSLPMPCRTQSR